MADVKTHKGVEEEEGGVERVCERVVTQVEGGQTVPRLYYHPGEGRGGEGRRGKGDVQEHTVDTEN